MTCELMKKNELGPRTYHYHLYNHIWLLSVTLIGGILLLWIPLFIFQSSIYIPLAARRIIQDSMPYGCLSGPRTHHHYSYNKISIRLWQLWSAGLYGFDSCRLFFFLNITESHTYPACSRVHYTILYAILLIISSLLARHIAENLFTSTLLTFPHTDRPRLIINHRGRQT